MYRNGAMPLPGPGRFGKVEPRADELFDRLVATSPYLGEPVESSLGKVVPVSVLGQREQRDTRLFAGDEAISHVEIVVGSPGDGALVPDLVADALAISPGERIVVGSPDDGTVTLTVDGIYRSLYRGGASGYWRPWNDELVLYCSNCAPPPQAVIVPMDRFVGAARAIGLDHAGYAWQAPVRRELTLQEAEDAARIAFDISDEIDDASVLDRCFISFFCNLRNGPVWGSAIDDVVNDVHGRLVAIEGPARLLRLAGMLVALVVVAGAGAFAMAARRVESNLLFVAPRLKPSCRARPARPWVSGSPSRSFAASVRTAHWPAGQRTKRSGPPGSRGSRPSSRSRPCRPSRSSGSPNTTAAGCASSGRCRGSSPSSRCRS
jgi:hypothetical protein